MESLGLDSCHRGRRDASCAGGFPRERETRRKKFYSAVPHEHCRDARRVPRGPYLVPAAKIQPADRCREPSDQAFFPSFPVARIADRFPPPSKKKKVDS
uniref:Uncharacterized protein n=1 Tax=Setaria italica TaxID=4555 RepID=K3ZB52_SETIT